MQHNSEVKSFKAKKMLQESYFNQYLAIHLENLLTSSVPLANLCRDILLHLPLLWTFHIITEYIMHLHWNKSAEQLHR